MAGKKRSCNRTNIELKLVEGFEVRTYCIVVIVLI